jgi:hypothetical protein
MRKKFLKIGVYIGIGLVSIGLTACMSGTPPKPYAQKIDLKSHLSLEKQQSILNDIVKESIDGFHVENACVSTSVRWSFKSVDKYKNCFIINPDATVERKDYSQCIKNRQNVKCTYSGRNMEKYVKALNKTQDQINVKLPNELKTYAEIEPLYNQEEKKLALKVSKVKFSIVDDTKALPKKILKKLEKIAHARGEVIYYKNDFIKKFSILPLDKIKKSIEFNFKVETCATSNCFGYVEENVDNWAIVFDKQSKAYNYNDVPLDVTYHVSSALFHYYPPEKFVLEDSYIKIEVNNKLQKNSSMRSFIIYNKTDKYISINKISGYYNGKIVNLLATSTKGDAAITLPPHSYKDLLDVRFLFKGRNFPSSIVWKNIVADKKSPSYLKGKSFLNAKDFYKTSIDYGFAVSYLLNDANVHKTLYKVENYTAKDLFRK